MEYGASGDVLIAKYHGAWLIVGNGYLSWLATIPLKVMADQHEI